MIRIFRRPYLLSLAVTLASLGLPGPVLAAPPSGVVILGDLSASERQATLVALGAAQPPPLLLWDAPSSRAQAVRFLREFGPRSLNYVGTIPASIGEDLPALPRSIPLELKRGRPVDLWKSQYPTAARLVVAPASSRRFLLQASALASALRAPLFVWHDSADTNDLLAWTARWRTQEIFWVGEAACTSGLVPTLRSTLLTCESEVEQAATTALRQRAPIRTLIVANSADARLAELAPWLAHLKNAALRLTDSPGPDFWRRIDSELREAPLRDVEHVILLGNHKAIPVEARPNPAAGKDTVIEMEPLTPQDASPVSYAVGRLLDDPGSVCLQLARVWLIRPDVPKRALIASNPGGGLPLLETISRHTAAEIRNRGFETTALFGQDVEVEQVRGQLPLADLFLWEGHHSTLIKEYGFLEWNEPLRPALVMLQSCLALTEEKALPVQRRGALAVVGSSSRVYSATGGAFSLAFIDALLYDGQTLGGAMRQAKNFLLAYQMLKEKRLGASAKLGGANLRSAWAFTLWGDPTLQFPLPARANTSLPEICPQIQCVAPKGNGNERQTLEIVLRIPTTAYEKAGTGKFKAMMWPNTRLAGLIRTDDDGSNLVPFLFAEVALPDQDGVPPRLTSTIPEANWSFMWDARRNVGYLLVMPRTKDVGDLRFTLRGRAH